MLSHIEIHTARLKLSPYSTEDLDTLHGIFIDPQIRKYLCDDSIMPREWVATEIENNTKCFEQHSFGQWSQYWGKGLATEATEAMIQYGFTEHKFEQIISATDLGNIASARVMERVGMKFVRCVKKNGLELLYYAISREEYQLDRSLYSLHIQVSN